MTADARAPSSRRHEIQGIAADLFASRGFANVTVDDIGEAAGVSGPALYHHFAGKEALLGEMLVGTSQQLLEGGRHIRDSSTNALPILVRFHCEFAVHNRSLITVHIRDLIHATDNDQRRIRQLQGRYVTIWSDALVHRWPGIYPGTSRAAIHAAFGLINSAPFRTSRSRRDVVAMLERMAVVALDSVADDRAEVCPS